MKGVLFDFNGVLFEDSEFHEQAWKEISAQIRGFDLTPEEQINYIHGRQNRFVFEYLFNRSISNDELLHWEQQKEHRYREICLQNRSKICLSSGAIKIFEQLNKFRLPFTIVTSSNKENLKFFFQIFELQNWFKFEKIVYDDGMVKGKPDPDPYIKGSQKLGLLPSECVVVEDSLSGITSAKRAGIGLIIGYGPLSKHVELLKFGADKVIASFHPLNLNFILVKSTDNSQRCFYARPIKKTDSFVSYIHCKL